MATFLELVQDLARQSGTLAGASSLASVQGATGRAEKLVDWVSKAWLDVQRKRDCWRWMHREFTSALIADTRRYTAASFNITSFSKWVQDTRFHRPFTLYDPAEGAEREQEIFFVAWDVWKRAYDRGVHDVMRPVCYSISPANELCFGPTPDKAYVLKGEYWKGPQTLAANGDTPECPSRFHDIIVWRAMQYMAEADESPSTLQAATNEFTPLWRDLCADQLPAIGLARGNVLA